jgi:outer membrane receptor protein involved in Fe transport
MTKPNRLNRPASVLAVLFALMSVAHGQTPAPKPATTKPATENDKKIPVEEVVSLNPFEVRADTDNSYGALESNSLTAFRMDLTKAPATAQVFTQTFMDDIAATSIEEVLTGYTGTVTASSNNPGAVFDVPGDRDGSQGLSIRGVGAGEIKRDGFIGPPNNARTGSGQTDNFSIDRVEVIEGPQSLLYGSVGGGGVTNSTSKRAQFNSTKGSLRVMFDRYGTKRATLDYSVGRQNVAMRVAVVGADNATNRYKLGSELYGYYAQLAFRPFRNTTIRISTEKTDNDAIVGFKPNLNNFLSATDPRRGKDARFLALTNQVSDIPVYNVPLNYGNLESSGSWFSSERIHTHWNNIVMETKLGYGFSAQVIGVYTDTVDDRVTDGRNLLPAKGLPNAGANPFDVTAVQIGSPVQINEQRDRNKGVRVAFVHEADFSFWKLRGHSQTAFGGQAFHRGPAFGSSGIAQVYYQADANWNVLYTNAAGVQSTTPDYTRSEYGRTQLQFVYFPVQNGIPSKPLFRPGQRQITYNGQNYVLDDRIHADAARITDQNPFGLIPNAPTTANPNAFSGNWNRGGETHSGSAYVANFTDWFDGKLTTLVGYSVTRFETLNVGAGFGNLTPTPKDNHPGWQTGLNYRVLPWLRAYAALGTAEQAEASTGDIYGNPLKNPQASNSLPELGLKITSLDGRYAAQLSWNPETLTKNENRNTGDTSFRDAINPDGVNGRVGGTAANQRVNVDRTLSSQELVLTANPTKEWRMRLSATHLDGDIASDVIYQQVYNDEFRTSAGTVVYSDGTAVLVDPAAAGGAKTQALTVAMINDPTSKYYAQPDATSGRITNTTLRTVLITTDPTHGSATTGRVGLPMSSMQYSFTSPYPNGTVVIYQKGEKNTGFNELSFNFSNKYTFSSGRLKGFGIFTDVATYAKNRAYYVNYPDTSGSLLGTKITRELYRLPRATVLNLGFSYSRKGLPWIGDRVSWSTQLNIKNALNHYVIWVAPTSSNGSTLNARYSTQPRQIQWTNTISF